MKILLLMLVAMASLHRPKAPERSLSVRESLWVRAEPRAEDVLRIGKAVDLFKAARKRYEEVAKNGCPAAVIFVFHMRESTWNFSKHLHEGSPLSGRTKWIPKGRIPGKNPPYQWSESADDALYVLKSYHRSEKWQTIDSMVDWIERFNGIGYRNKNGASPYLVAASKAQKPGKYVADSKYDPKAWDRQLGCLTVLRALEKQGLFTPPPYDL